MPNSIYGDLLRDGARYYHVHIPKTSGTALREYFSQHFEVDELPSAAQYLALSALTANCASINTVQFSNVRLFAGAHVSKSFYQSIADSYSGGVHKFFCMFRNPAARIESLLNHFARVSRSDVELAVSEGRLNTAAAQRRLLLHDLCKTGDVVQALSRMISRDSAETLMEGVVNLQSRFLMRHSSSMPTAEDYDEILASMTNTDVVGVQEDFLGTLWKMAYLFNLPMPEIGHVANISRNKLSHTAESRALMRGCQPMDWQLYGDVLRRHYWEVANLPEPKNYNREWSRRRIVSQVKDNVIVSMRKPIFGWGWNVREGENSDIRWLGQRAVLFVPLARARSYNVEVSLSGYMNVELLKSINLLVDQKVLITFSCYFDSRGDAVLVASLSGNFIAQEGLTRLDFISDVAITHADLGEVCDDFRLKSIAVKSIVFY